MRGRRRVRLDGLVPCLEGVGGLGLRRALAPQEVVRLRPEHRIECGQGAWTCSFGHSLMLGRELYIKSIGKIQDVSNILAWVSKTRGLINAAGLRTRNIFIR